MLLRVPLTLILQHYIYIYIFSPLGADENLFQTQFLEAHNKYRKKHNVPPMRLNAELSKSAQTWANHLLSINKMQHSGAGGENLYYSYSSRGNVAVDAWYNEVKDYDYNKPGFKAATGHFTQVVWKDSKELGVGVATDGKGTFYVVGRYSPPGNVIGQFQENVLRPK
uniref:SCP domain-containing protein n=1 Tax=Xenopus tropicalis TaxID=8364 RepID=A0A803J2F5_XENTR